MRNRRVRRVAIWRIDAGSVIERRSGLLQMMRGKSGCWLRVRRVGSGSSVVIWANGVVWEIEMNGVALKICSMHYRSRLQRKDFHGRDKGKDGSRHRTPLHYLVQNIRLSSHQLDGD